jgi:predicted nucleic acid-binding protein
VENARVTKIFDNTAISAFINEILSVRMLVVCTKRYTLTTSIEVYFEALVGTDQKTIDSCFSDIQIVDKNPQANYRGLIEELSDRYPYLHKGDISSFLLAYMDYAVHGKPYFFVTDDKTLRKRIPDLLVSDTLKSLTKKEIRQFNVTGIIGLMRHIADVGDLSESDIELIIIDLRKSTFYVTEELLSYLRSGKK